MWRSAGFCRSVVEALRVTAAFARTAGIWTCAVELAFTRPEILVGNTGAAAAGIAGKVSAKARAKPVIVFVIFI
jgi:hypothetical protein